MVFSCFTFSAKSPFKLFRICCKLSSTASNSFGKVSFNTSFTRLATVGDFPLVALYTLFLGGVIIKKAIKKTTKRKPIRKLGILATFGGFLDSVGGGGWGPIVSSSLIASGRSPLYTIGSVNLAEFFVSLASSITFITLLGFNHWQVVAGLVLGGVVAAPIAAVLARKLPIKTMMILVGVIVIVVSLRNIITMIF